MLVRTRFAPSPTGYLHIGGLRTALYSWLFARKNHGQFILRIEDTDQKRETEGACKVIYDTLNLTGLTYDEGPDIGGAFGPYIQSERKEIYLEYAKKLIEKGAAYYCFCTKERLDSLREGRKDGNTAYDKHCLNLPKEEVERLLKEGVPYVIRQNIPNEGVYTYKDEVYGEVSVPLADLDDNILIKSDGFPTYNLANVIDDHLMAITHVIRGVEYLSSTPKYNLIYDALEWPKPMYIHLPPVMRDKNNKLSKRHGDASFKDFLDKGYLKEAIINYIALLGWSSGDEQEFFTLDELVEKFSISGLNRSPAIFDIDKLKWMNAQYIRQLPPVEFLRLSTPYYVKVLPHNRFNFSLISRLIQPRLETMTEIYDKLEFLMEFSEYDMELFVSKKMKTTPKDCLPFLTSSLKVLEKLNDYSEEGIKDVLLKLAEELGIKSGKLLGPLRTAVTGVPVTPGGAIEVICLLGKEESLRRLKISIDLLKKYLSTGEDK
ncbi:MAG: glutamate--tRNA ligase [Eubacteriales bacterium]